MEQESPTSIIKSPSFKLFAVLNDDDVVIDGWLANSFEEAQTDNPNKKIVEVTFYNGPAYINGKWNKEKFIL